MSYRSPGIVLAEKPSIGIEPTRLYDASRNKNHGVHTAVTMVQLPKGLWVRSFNGSSSLISIPDAPSLSALAPITIACWFNQDIQGLEGLVTKRASASAAREWDMLLDASGRLGFNQWNPASGSASNYLTTTGTVNVSDNAWHLGLVTWNGINAVGNITLYIDGEIEALTADTKEGTGGVAGDTTTNIEIGRLLENNTYCFDGKIALIRICNYALSAGQINKIFNKERSLFDV